MYLSPPDAPPTALHHVDALPAGTRLAEFEVQALMGVGGFGMVYRAYDHSLHRVVAIKEYMPGVLAGRAGMSVALRSSSDERAFGAGLRSFMAEARLLAQFDHPSLVKVFRVWEQNRTAYMVMPFYRGVTLKQARAQMRTPPPEAWLRKLLWSVLEALKVLHRHHTVHRDVSPDNIFLQDNGPPVLLDLGAARRALGDRTQRHTAILKVNYAPIEQYADADDMRQGPWSDLYALAAVVHGCLCDGPPLPATFRLLRDRMPSLAEVAQGLQEAHGLAYSAPFVAGLGQALAIQPADRPQSVAALVELLQLQAPPDIERFDWRAELGDIWEPSRQTAAVAHGTYAPDSPTLHLGVTPQPSSDEHPYVETVVWPAQRPDAVGASDDAARQAMPSAAASVLQAAQASRGRQRWLHVGASAVIVGLLAAVAIVAMPSRAPVMPAPAPAAVAAVPIAAPAPEPAPAPVAVPASVEVPEVEAPPPMALAESAMVREPARPARTARPTRPLTAQDICPDSNFLTRPMCLHRECQKAAYAATPVCVENTRRLREGNHYNGG